MDKFDRVVSSALLIVAVFIGALYSAWISATRVIGLFLSIVDFGAGIARSVPLPPNSFINLLHIVGGVMLAVGGALLIIGWIIFIIFIFMFSVNKLWGVIWRTKK